MAIDIKAKRGDDWEIRNTALEEGTNDPIPDYFDLVTRADIQVRRSAEDEDVIVSFSTEDSSISLSGAVFTLTKDHEDTEGLPIGVFVYDMQCINNGRRRTMAEGTFEIVADITRLSP